MSKNMALGSSEVALGETLLHLSAQKHVVLLDNIYLCVSESVLRSDENSQTVSS